MSKGKNIVAPFDETEEEQLKKQIFNATFSMLAKLTGADGNVSTDEIRIIDRFMREGLNLDEERRKYAIAVFNLARREEHDFDHYARQYKELLADKPSMLEWMLDVLLRVSLVDKEFNETERVLIKSAQRIFGISDEKYAQLEARYRSKSPASENASEQSTAGVAYARLQLVETAAEDEIVLRHKELSLTYSPSRIIELGLPDEFVRLAEQLYAEIQEAFQQIKKSRGMR